MTLFHAPSPSGRNAAKLYLNEAGHLFDGRTGSYWGRSGIVRMKMAMDQELHHDRGETAEALLALRSDIEKCMSELDLHEEVKRELFECLNRHIRPGQHTKGGPGPKSRCGAAIFGPLSMTEKVEQLRMRVASSENKERLRRLLREAEQLGADDLIERIDAKLAKLGGKPAGGVLCPQLRQVIEPWVTDEFGNPSRLSYSVDAVISVGRADG
jgi:hypothetical protein